MKLIHISTLFFDNIGDKYLSYSVKKIFEDRFGKIEWFDFDIRLLCSQKDINLFNEYNGIIIGGGGLILPSSFYKKIETGWTLGIPTNLINKIATPLIGYGIGYNLFRGEEIVDDIFKNNIEGLISRSSFFSLRHNTDIEKIKNYINEDFGNKIRLNFCASLFGEKYQKASSNSIAFEFAWDRLNNRFSNKRNIVKFIHNMTMVCKILSAENKKIYLVSHTRADLLMNTKIFKKWKQKGIDCEFTNLVGKNRRFFLDFYYNIKTVFAMRGHGQMIPMGLGCNVVSLISHDKILGFLDDLDITCTGVEVNDENFLEKCLNAYSYSNNIDFQFVLQKARRNIDCNMDIIEKILKQ